jgi:hypothetical protein
MKPNKSFWITNISDRNVSLSDLNISVPAMSSVNLLDINHYSFTESQVANSAKNGSIFRKSDKIVVRKVPPKTPLSKRPIEIIHPLLPNRSKSIYEIKVQEYEELNIDLPEESLGEISDGDDNAKIK